MQVRQIKLSKVGIRPTVRGQQVVGERGRVDAEGVEAVEGEEVYAKGKETREEASEVFEVAGGGYAAFPHGCVGHVEEVTFGGEEKQVVDDV